MIRVSRGPELDRLRLERRRRLSRAILARRKNEDIDFEGYAVVKDELVNRLNRKCVYCECWLRVEGSPVEHFPDHLARHWMLLLAADKVDAIESNIGGLAHRALPSLALGAAATLLLRRRMRIGRR